MATNRNTKPLSITLTLDQQEWVKSLVANGGYASDSEVIREGLRVLKAREQATEKWLREEVIPAYEELRANPGSGMSVDQVRAALRDRQKRSA